MPTLQDVSSILGRPGAPGWLICLLGCNDCSLSRFRERPRFGKTAAGPQVCTVKKKKKKNDAPVSP